MKAFCKVRSFGGPRMFWHRTARFFSLPTKTGFARSSASVRVVSGVRVTHQTRRAVPRTLVRPFRTYSAKIYPLSWQPLASSHIRPTKYTTFPPILQYFGRFFPFKFYVEVLQNLRPCFCLLCTKTSVFRHFEPFCLPFLSLFLHVSSTFFVSFVIFHTFPLFKCAPPTFLFPKCGWYAPHCSYFVHELLLY